MKKIIVSLGLAAALAVGTAAPASADPNRTPMGKTCQAYKIEQGFNYVTSRWVARTWKLQNDTAWRCYYLYERTTSSLGVRLSTERKNVYFNKVL